MANYHKLIIVLLAFLFSLVIAPTKSNCAEFKIGAFQLNRTSNIFLAKIYVSPPTGSTQDTNLEQLKIKLDSNSQILFYNLKYNNWGSFFIENDKLPLLKSISLLYISDPQKTISFTIIDPINSTNTTLATGQIELSSF